MAIRLDGLPRRQAEDAIAHGFSEVERIHRLMSFHESSSDVGRMNREAAQRPVQVHPCTYEVVRMSQAVARASKGVFDISVGGKLAELGLLPRLAQAPLPVSGASWRDIELGEDNTIRFHRPLWIDLGGIAKGYAVDRAVDAMAAAAPVQCVVNAGGDMRVVGAYAERVLLGVERPGEAEVPVLEIENASVASSSGTRTGGARGEIPHGVHLHGRKRAIVGSRSFVSVVAPSCVVADALTKVVLAERRRAADVLRAHGSAAYLHDSRRGWQAIACEPPRSARTFP